MLRGGLRRLKRVGRREARIDGMDGGFDVDEMVVGGW